MKEEEEPRVQREPRYGWVLTAAVFASNALSVGYYRAFGVFFVEIIDTFHSSASFTSLIMGLQAGVLSLSALLVHNVLLPLVGERRSAILGGFLMASGMMITTFGTSVFFLIFSISFLVGLGNAMTYGPGFVLLGEYFDRRRALAMGVANTGSSAGSILLPLLATHLLETYGLSGAWLLYGAVTLHLCVFASLYRPLDPELLTEREQCWADEEESKQALMTGEKGRNSAQNGENIANGNHIECTKPNGENGESIRKGNHHATPIMAANTSGDNFENDSKEANVNVGSLSTKANLRISLADIEYNLENNVLKTEQILVKRLDGASSCSKCPGVLSSSGTRTGHHLAEGTDAAKSFLSAENVFAGKTKTTANCHGVLHGRRSSTLGDLRFAAFQNNRHVTHNESSAIYHSSSAIRNRPNDTALTDAAMHSSHPHLVVLTSSTHSLHTDKPQPPPSTSPERTKPSSCWSKIACDRNLLRKPGFWLVQAYSCFGVVGSVGAAVYLPSLCQERGVSKEDTSVVLTILGAINLLGRVLCGVLADRRWIRPSHISIVSFLIIALLFNALPLFPGSLGSMVGVAVVYGLFEGAYWTTLPLIIIDLLSLKHFSRTFGFVQLSQGMFATFLYPVLGRLKDLTGNYHAMFHCLGLCALTASVLLMVESLQRAVRNNT